MSFHYTIFLPIFKMKVLFQPEIIER